MFAGRFSVSDRQRVDERRLNASAKTSAGHRWPVERFGEGSCVRQKRVVLAPVAGVKSAEVFAKPNRVRKTVNSPMTEAKGIRLREERAISRQTIVQGRPDALRWTCMLVCVFFLPFAHETAGAARTRSSLRPPWARASVKPRAQRAARSRVCACGQPSLPQAFRYPKAQMIEPKMIEPKRRDAFGGLPHLRPECPPTEVCHSPSGSRRAHGLMFYPTG